MRWTASQTILEIPTMTLLWVQHSLSESSRDKVIMAEIIGCLTKEQISFCRIYLINCQSTLIWVLCKEISMKKPSSTITGKWWAARGFTPDGSWSKTSFKFWRMDLSELAAQKQLDSLLLKNLKVKNKW
jgi:hypothetical protein